MAQRISRRKAMKSSQTLHWSCYWNNWVGIRLMPFLFAVSLYCSNQEKCSEIITNITLKLLLKQMSRNETNAFSFCSLSVLFSHPPPPGTRQGGVLTSRVTSLPCCFCNWLICLFWPGFSPRRQTFLASILDICYRRCWPQEWMQETFSLTLFGMNIAYGFGCYPVLWR